MVGSDSWQWRDPGTDYDANWKEMVQSFQALPSSPKVFVMIPPPLYKEGQFDMRGDVINGARINGPHASDASAAFGRLLPHQDS